MVSSWAMIWMGLTALFGFLLPVIVLIIWKKRTQSRLMPALVGAIIFVVFALVLEGIPKVFLFGGKTGISDYILHHAWAYTLAGCLLAGVFEEVGRYVAFKWFLKNYNDRRDGVTYGIGHGGIESIILFGITQLSYIFIAAMINGGNTDTLTAGLSQVQASSVNTQIQTVLAFGAVKGILGCLERILAMILHVSLSVMVFAAVKEKGKGWMFPVAILLHGIFDVPAALYQYGMLSMGLCELLLVIACATIAVFAYQQYQAMAPEGMVEL